MNQLDQIRTGFGFAPKESAVSLGRGHGFPWRKEWLTESQINHHVHIWASGFGKTVLLSHIVKDRIAKGNGLLFVDLKGDRETIEQFTGFVRDAGRLQDLKVLSLSEHEASTGYNLLSRATANQLRDKVMKSFEWSEEFYKNQASGYLLKVLTGRCWLRDNKSQEFGLHELHACVDKPKAIQKLLTDIPIDSGRARVMMEEAFTFLSSTEDAKPMNLSFTQMSLSRLELVNASGLVVTQCQWRKGLKSGRSIDWDSRKHGSPLLLSLASVDRGIQTVFNWRLLHGLSQRFDRSLENFK